MTRWGARQFPASPRATAGPCGPPTPAAAGATAPLARCQRPAGRQRRGQRGELVAGAHRHHDVVLAEHLLVAGTDPQRAVAGPQREQHRPGAAQVGGGACAPRIGAHHQLLDPHRAVGAADQQVEGVHHRRLHRQRRHPPAAQRVRADHPVGPGAAQLLGGVGVGRAGDDVEVGPERARGEHDVDVALVGVDGADQGPGAADPRPLQDLVVGGVTEDVEDPVLLHVGEPVRVPLDDHELLLGLGELDARLPSGAPVSADDDVIPQCVQPALHLTNPPVALQIAARQ